MSDLQTIPAEIYIDQNGEPPHLVICFNTQDDGAVSVALAVTQGEAGLLAAVSQFARRDYGVYTPHSLNAATDEPDGDSSDEADDFLSEWINWPGEF